MPSVTCSAIQLFFVFLEHLHTLLSLHSMRCILCALCFISCHLSFLLLWGIPASPYFHILCISCGYLPYAPLVNNSFSQQTFQSFFLACPSVVLSVISYHTHIQFLIVHSFSLVTSFVSHSTGIPSSVYTLYHHLLSHLIFCFPHRSHSIIAHYPHSHYCFTY